MDALILSHINKKPSKALNEIRAELNIIIYDYSRILKMDPEEFFQDFELETGQKFGPEYDESKS